MLLKFRADLCAKSNDGNTCLHTEQCVDVVKYIFDHQREDGWSHGVLDVEAKNKNLRTPLMLASSGEVALIDATTQDANKWTPLRFASAQNKIEVCEVLISARCNVTHMDGNDRSALFDATAVALSLLLKSELKEVLNTPDINGHTVLHAPSADAAQLLLQAHGDLNVKSNIGWLPVMTHVQGNRPDIIACLAEAKADLSSARNHRGNPAFWLSVIFNTPKVMPAILEQASDEQTQELLAQRQVDRDQRSIVAVALSPEKGGLSTQLVHILAEKKADLMSPCDVFGCAPFEYCRTHLQFQFLRDAGVNYTGIINQETQVNILLTQASKCTAVLKELLSSGEIR